MFITFCGLGVLAGTERYPGMNQLMISADAAAPRAYVYVQKKGVGPSTMGGSPTQETKSLVLFCFCSPQKGDRIRRKKSPLLLFFLLPLKRGSIPQERALRFLSVLAAAPSLQNG